MANIFKENKAVNEHPNRNNFDLSKKSNVSLKFGTLYPVYCQPVVPGDSFDINVAYNLKLMPVVFPVQTKMRAHMHFFYVRNKNLWSNWENWISNLPNATQSLTPHPYLSVPDDKFKSGSIHDFLGVPTSLVRSNSFDTFAFFPLYRESITPLYYVNGSGSVSAGDTFSSHFSFDSGSNTHTCVCFSFLSPVPLEFDSFDLSDLFSDLLNYVDNSFSIKDGYRFFIGDSLESSECDGIERTFVYDSQKLSLSSSDIVDLNNYISSGKNVYFVSYGNPVSSVTPFDAFLPVTSAAYGIPYTVYRSGFEDYSDLNLPLYSNILHINALPYRAYESCYWAYYNNNVVSPMTINGEVQYNRYNTNLGDGADTTDYHLFQRNYELDFLTSSLPSPQQGVAPLVGMTALGDVTIEDENGITTAHAEIDNDGTITKIVLTSPAASVEHARTAMNIAASGMSINDFRQTNALQRVLETNIRKGYRYMDFIAGHFGKEPEYRELDMPEFIGGFSRDVNVSTVVSQADTLGDDIGKALGSYGGFAQVVGGTNHAIRHYCDDYGYIIGILSVVPTPCYSQLLPKHMIAPDNFLDYYFPEFSQSGLMPITYKEVAPIQSYLDSLSDNTKSLEDTFGYQRPNYDMVSAVDEVHGEFRGSLRNYVINRIFDTRPELGRSFLQINPSEINDIFVNTNPDDDTIIGEIGFAVHAKRPVPRVVIPNLGR